MDDWQSRQNPGWDASRGYAQLFQETVLQAEDGCDFNFLRAAAPK
jgi:dihydroxy-acid dehydratase